MDETTNLVVMTLDDLRLGLPLADVDRVIRAVEVTPLPEAPPVVLGVVNMQGKIVVVINLRKRCRLPDKAIEPDDHFVVAHTPKSLVALVVDHAVVEQLPAGATAEPGDVVSNLSFVRAIVKRQDGLILVCNLAALLSGDDEQTLRGVMTSVTAAQ